MENIIIIRYAEIYLKGLNRPYFENALIKNTSGILSDIAGAVVKKGESRVYVEGVSDNDLNRALEKLQFVYGIHSYSPAIRAEQDLNIAAKMLADLVKAEKDEMGKDAASFRVEAKRADKRFPMKSLDIAR